MTSRTSVSGLGGPEDVSILYSEGDVVRAAIPSVHARAHTRPMPSQHSRYQQVE